MRSASPRSPVTMPPQTVLRPKPKPKRLQFTLMVVTVRMADSFTRNLRNLENGKNNEFYRRSRASFCFLTVIAARPMPPTISFKTTQATTQCYFSSRTRETGHGVISLPEVSRLLLLNSTSTRGLRQDVLVAGDEPEPGPWPKIVAEVARLQAAFWASGHISRKS
jgi:hypothetical protein